MAIESRPERSRARSCLAAMLLVGCLGAAAVDADAAPADAGEVLIRVWSHQGQEAENRAMREIAAAFNRAHAGRIRAEISFFPDFQYTEKVAIAAAAQDLPDVLELDGPLVARFAEAGLLAPVGRWFSAEEQADFLPTILEQGTIGGELYALGAFDSAVVLYYDREMLGRAGVTPPPTTGWTWTEFTAACRRLRAAGIEPVAMHMNETADEWYTYAFSPLVWSGGGELISADGRSVRGVLASSANAKTLEAWQGLFVEGFAATDPVDPDPFGNGTVAMDWSGHWMARSHLATKGERLGAMLLPRMGPEPSAPCGSWCWGMAASARHPESAAAWLRWITHPEHGVAPIVRANGAVPARRSAFRLFPEYAGLPFQLFRHQLENHARPRPRTPFYPVLTQRFAAALRDIARGANVVETLQHAEDGVQAVIDRQLRTSAARLPSREQFASRCTVVQAPRSLRR